MYSIRPVLNIHAMKHIEFLKTCQKYVPIERNFFVFERKISFFRMQKTEAHVFYVLQIVNPHDFKCRVWFLKVAHCDISTVT